MKLFFCPHCSDIQKMVYNKRYCDCGKSWGYIKDTLKDKCAEGHISDGAMPIAMDNNYINIAWHSYSYDKRTSFIQSWTIDPTQIMNECIIEEHFEDEKTQSLPSK